MKWKAASASFHLTFRVNALRCKTAWFWGVKKITLSHELGSKWTSERTSERSGARKQSKQCGASKRVSSASERTSERRSTYAPIFRCFKPQCNAVMLTHILFINYFKAASLLVQIRLFSRGSTIQLSLRGRNFYTVWCLRKARDTRFLWYIR